MTLLAQMAMQGAVGFAIGAGTNELAIRWVFNALFTKKKKLIAENTKRLIRTELMTSEKIAAWLCKRGVIDLRRGPGHGVSGREPAAHDRGDGHVEHSLRDDNGL